MIMFPVGSFSRSPLGGLILGQVHSRSSTEWVLTALVYDHNNHRHVHMFSMKGHSPAGEAVLQPQKAL